MPGVTLICGRFEGVDERVLEARAIEEVSLGDFVLSGGEPAAIALIDACVRLLPGRRRVRRDAGGGEFCRGAARISALYPAAAVAGAGGAGGAGVGRPSRRSGSGGGREAERLTRERRPDLWRRYRARRKTGAAAIETRGGAMNLLQQLEAEQVDKLVAARPVPPFQPGDTVRVSVRVVEGERERIQAFEGVCIARKNAGINSNFTLRKISYGEGVERVFPLYSPRITAIEVVRRGAVRRAKLYYLRGRTGKSARIAERGRDDNRRERAPRPKPRRSATECRRCPQRGPGDCRAPVAIRT